MPMYLWPVGVTGTSNQGHFGSPIPPVCSILHSPSSIQSFPLLVVVVMWLHSSINAPWQEEAE